MRLPTRTPRRVAIAGLTVVAASALAACSTDLPANPFGDTSGSEVSEDTGTAAAQPPVEELVLAEGEAPGGGVVQVIDRPLLQEAVDKLVADQGRQLMEDPACDKVSRLETVTNSATTGGVTVVVRYKQSEVDETEHPFGIGMVGRRLDEFLDRSLYEACVTSRSVANPNVELFMRVEDAPLVEGAEGFRVISDLVTTLPDGTQQINRVVAIHGYARDTTVSVEYAAHGSDPTVDPVLPTAANALDGIYVSQMEKIVSTP